MKNLSQVFGKTVAPAALKGKQKSDNTEESNSDPMLEAYVPSDTFDFQSLGKNFPQTAFSSLNNSATTGLPSLSRGYSSQGGGLLNVVG